MDKILFYLFCLLFKIVDEDQSELENECIQNQNIYESPESADNQHVFCRNILPASWLGMPDSSCDIRMCDKHR